MNLVNSIADMSMAMSAAKFQQDLGLTMMKKTMETSVDMVKGVLDMADSIPHFPGANGSILDVRA
ncbi:MAG: YjfB family protein [Oscillospiraceae bacterium]|nr:YjfB family protein [Oscillospiraceae bacterium]